MCPVPVNSTELISVNRTLLLYTISITMVLVPFFYRYQKLTLLIRVSSYSWIPCLVEAGCGGEESKGCWDSIGEESKGCWDSRGEESRGCWDRGGDENKGCWESTGLGSEGLWLVIW